MNLRVERLILTILLFGGWLGYLGYLVVCRPHTPGGLLGAFEGRPLTLSRPQFLISTLDVIADVSGDNGEHVVIKEVLFPEKDAPVKPGETIAVEHIEECQGDYTGPGTYLLPLQILEGGKGARRFQVAPTPPSPGYPTLQGVHVGPPHIYPATDEMRAEYRQIAKP